MNIFSKCKKCGHEQDVNIGGRGGRLAKHACESCKQKALTPIRHAKQPHSEYLLKQGLKRIHDRCAQGPIKIY